MSIYKRIYDNLVYSHQGLKEEWEPVGSGLVRYRILPGHQGGTYIEDNCSYLNHREHISAHWLLWKLHGNHGDYKAWRCMSGRDPIPSRLGAKHTDESKEKMSIAKKGTYVPWNKGLKGEQKAWNKGISPTQEVRTKISKTLTGKPMPEETKLKISKTIKAKQRKKHETK